MQKKAAAVNSLLEDITRAPLVPIAGPGPFSVWESVSLCQLLIYNTLAVEYVLQLSRPVSVGMERVPREKEAGKKETLSADFFRNAGPAFNEADAAAAAAGKDN